MMLQLNAMSRIHLALLTFTRSNEIDKECETHLVLMRNNEKDS